MATLSPDVRTRILEKTIVEARRIAESGSQSALQSLAVDKSEFFPTMSPIEQSLRRRLRAHGRQVGDTLDEKTKTQSISHLTQACAYEHWHRMLFARFLAENELLLEPEHGIALSLDDVKGRARELDKDWLQVASEFAQGMLLDVFRPGDPVLEVTLPPEKRQQLEAKLEQLPPEVFTADDSLGWVYQFWQKEEKERINRSEKKIGKDELSPVTQLFTEDYMVLFLLHNTLGAWWTAKYGTSRLDGYEWTYLRLNEDGSPSAGKFEGWPAYAKQLRLLDPSMGSGHFLVFALPILVRMRMMEEGIALRAAIWAVLQDNLFGLELDPRCSQIAAFNIALTAWRLGGGFFALPRLQLGCSGLGINAGEADWLKLAGSDSRARATMQKLFELFQKAPTLGSLIDPLQVGDLITARFDEVQPLVERALAQEFLGDEEKELAIAAEGLLAAARILGQRFTLVATNVPYLVKAKQNKELREFCEKYAPDAIADLATVFLQRCYEFCAPGGTHATVTPNNWLFLKSYSRFRRRLLKQQTVCHVTTIGSGMTATASWDVLRALVIASRMRAEDYEITGTGTEAAREEQRAADIKGNPIAKTLASTLLGSTTCRIAISSMAGGSPLSSVAASLQGTSTGDNPRYQLFFWECPELGAIWEPLQGAVSFSHPFGGREKMLRWEAGIGDLAGSSGSAIRGLQALGKCGVAVTQMRSLPATFFTGTLFDTNVAVLLPKEESDVLAIWAYCSSEEFAASVRKIDKKIGVTNATFEEVHFDRVHWNEVARAQYPNGFPTPHSDDPTQWLFEGHPANSTYPLQVAVARLVGYRWPRQTGSSFLYAPVVGSINLESHEAEDGIVCLNSVQGQPTAAERLRPILADAFGERWSAAVLSRLIGAEESLDTWLRNVFFAQHCEVFQSRPFVWHIWDGRKDGFHVLVNYHKLAGPNGEGRRTLERLIYTYLGDWIRTQERQIGKVDGADARIVAAQHLKQELEAILMGEAPFDIFVRWKPLHRQAIGWEPDLNDGVRLNIRPWLNAKPYRLERRCILREIPIKYPEKYLKDKGKEPFRDPEDFPWFAGSTDRNNSIHLAIAQKQAARLRKAGHETP